MDLIIVVMISLLLENSKKQLYSPCEIFFVLVKIRESRILFDYHWNC